MYLDAKKNSLSSQVLSEASSRMSQQDVFIYTNNFQHPAMYLYIHPSDKHFSASDTMMDELTPSGKARLPAFLQEVYIVPRLRKY